MELELCCCCVAVDGVMMMALGMFVDAYCIDIDGTVAVRNGMAGAEGGGHNTAAAAAYNVGAACAVEDDGVCDIDVLAGVDKRDQSYDDCYYSCSMMVEVTKMVRV